MSGTDELYEKSLAALLSRVLDMLRFAEAKNAALLAFASAWIVGIVNLLSSGRTLPYGYHGACLIALPLFVVAAIAAIVSMLPKLNAWALIGAPKGSSRNLLYFGDIAEMSVDAFKRDVRSSYKPVDAETPFSELYLGDLEAQIAINAKIAVRKHKIFHFGALSAAVAIGAFCVPVLVAIWNAVESAGGA